jgi:hypothetical protein
VNDRALLSGRTAIQALTVPEATTTGAWAVSGIFLETPIIAEKIPYIEMMVECTSNPEVENLAAVI